MKTRTLTATVFGAVMMGGMLTGKWPFTVLFLLIAVLCLWEFGGLVFLNANANLARKVLLTLHGMALPVALFFHTECGMDEHFRLFMWLGGTVLAFFAVGLFELFSNDPKPFQNLGYHALAVFYLGGAFACVPLISSNHFLSACGSNSHTPYLIISILLCVWSNDVFAYIVGRAIGKHKLFERISPKKTWEGSIGGVILCMGVGAGLACGMPHLGIVGMGFPAWMGLAAICALFGSLGDLFESMLKRYLGIKDSGTILPGHGGFLDRFDAFIFALPFATFYLFAIA